MSHSGTKTTQRALDKAEVAHIIDNKLENEYERLRWTPGFCIETMPWAHLHALIQEGTEQSLGQLGRHPRDIAVYWDFRRQVLERYASMGDYVKITKLDYAPSTDADGRITAAQPPAEEGGQPHITFRPNDFPYNFQQGVEHHNVWSTCPLTPEELQSVIESNRRGWECMHFVNPESLASIPAVWHAHVISRRAASD